MHGFISEDDDAGADVSGDSGEEDDDVEDGDGDHDVERVALWSPVDAGPSVYWRRKSPRCCDIVIERGFIFAEDVIQGEGVDEGQVDW